MIAKGQLPIGTETLILSKLYYGVLNKSLEHLDVERYYSVLIYLHDHKNCCQQTICNDLMIDKTAMVKVLDYLSKNGYIERKTNPEDRREHFISLSAKGLQGTKEILKAIRQIEKNTFKGISEHERNSFKRVLLQMTTNLKEMPSNDLFFNYKRTKK